MSEATAGILPINVGVAWCAECLSEDLWPEEIARLKESGISCVRLFEYAWHRFEPREWEFDFYWATRLLDLLREAGIKAIIATPTAAPPSWLAAKYPECLAVGMTGRRAVHGDSGRYASPVSPRYREFCSRIVDQMVHAFRGHDSIIGWEIDHEMRGGDYGNEARRLFHNWLHERHGSAETLNNLWGLEYRSQAYEYFEQVPVPRLGGHHPSLRIAYDRFLNDQWSTFVQTQVEVIRGGFETPIAISMHAGDWSMNYFRQNQLVDRVAMNLSTHDGGIERSLAWFDRMRAEKPGNAYWATDLAPSWHSDQARSPEHVLAQAWLALLMGAELVSFNPWREPSTARQLMSGVVSANGKWAAGRAAVTSFAGRMREHAAWLEAHPPVEARVALVFSNESAWAFAAQPPNAEFDYGEVWRDEFYTPVHNAHLWRDVIDQNADFCPYHIMIMPLLPMVYRPTKERLLEWVDGGGCLLIGPLTGHRTEEFVANPGDQEFGGLERLMGATSAGMAPAVGSTIEWSADNAPGAAVPSSTPAGLSHGFDATTAHILARYKGGYLNGQAAILMNKIGQGTVITIGSRIDRETYLDLVHTLCDLAKVTALASGSGDVAVIPRMNVDTSLAGYGLVNLTAQEQMITLPDSGTDRLTGHSRGPEVVLAPWEVLLLETAPVGLASASEINPADATSAPVGLASASETGTPAIASARPDPLETTVSPEPPQDIT